MTDKLGKTKKSKTFSLRKDNKYILISFLLSFLIINLVYICYEVIPYGNNTVLRMDLYHQYGPLFAELYDRLSSGSSLIYSWNSGCGSGFTGNFFNYLSSPLSLFILFFGHKNNPEAISFLIAIKVSLASAFFCYYLKNSKEFKKTDYSSVAFSILYSFCGYFIAYYWNVMWMDALVMLPLIALGIEKIINENKCIFYIVSLSITIIANYYLGYMLCIFCVMYATMYYFGKYKFSTKYLKVIDKITFKQKLRNSRFVMTLGRFAGSSIIVGLLCSFVLLPIYFILQNSSATSGSFPTNATFYFNTFDFLANHLAGLAPTIRSSGDSILPNVYCGIITVILTLIYLFTKSISTREKTSRIIMLVVLYFCFNLNYLNYIWHGFHFPNDLPYRQSFVYSFVLLCIAYKALERINEIENKDILKISIGVLLFVFIVEKVGSKNIMKTTILISAIFVIVYTFILITFNKYKLQRSIISIILLCCVIIEATVANTDHYVMDQCKTNYTQDYDSFKKVKETIEKKDKSPFYRMELADLNTRMDPSWFGYNGVSTFTSMAYENLANLQYNLGMFGNFINSYTYHPQTPVYNSMFGLKYIINNTNKNRVNNELYTNVGNVKKYKIYENKYTLPLAFCTNIELQQWTANSGNPFINQNNFIYYATGIDDVLNQLPVENVDYNNINTFNDDVNLGNYNYFKETNNVSGSYFMLNYTLPKKQNVYIYTKSDTIENNTIKIKVNGKEITNQNIDEEYILDIGQWNVGDKISVYIPVNNEASSGFVDCYAYGLNMDNFKKAYDKLNSSPLKLEKFKESEFEGTVNNNDTKLIYTSIPYDTSWNVYIDGNKADKNDVVKIDNALLGVKVSKGKHKIRFKYVPKGLVTGIAISVLTLIFVIIYEQRKKKNRGKNKI